MSLLLTVIRRWAARLAAGLLALGTGLGAASAATALPGPVVDVAWLKAHAKDVQIVDIRDDMRSLSNDPKWETRGGRKVLVENGGHLPDALSVNFWGLRAKHNIGGKTIDLLLPTAEEFQDTICAVQLQPNAVIYCNTGQYAAGAWFVLDRILGVKGLREYPGGLNEWVQRGLPIVGL